MSTPITAQPSTSRLGVLPLAVEKDSPATDPAAVVAAAAAAAATTKITLPTRRVQVSSACESCRARKKRCSGARPTCSKCSGRESECIYAAAPGLTRQRSMRSRHAELVEEVAALRSLLHRLAHQPAGAAERTLKLLRSTNDIKLVLETAAAGRIKVDFAGDINVAMTRKSALVTPASQDSRSAGGGLAALLNHRV